MTGLGQKRRLQFGRGSGTCPLLLQKKSQIEFGNRIKCLALSEEALAPT